MDDNDPAARLVQYLITHSTPNAFLSNLYQPPAARITAEDYQETVRSATQRLQECVRTQLVLFYSRALSLMLCCRFESAFQDALAIQAFAPTSPLGYMCAGQILCNQGKFIQASKEYAKGVQRVPTSDPNHGLLSLAVVLAQNEAEKYVDFIHQLPFDLAMMVISMVVTTTQDFFTYISVSKAWRERFMQGNLYFEIQAPHHDDLGQLMMVSPRVRSLTWKQCPLSMQEIWERYRFTALSRLCIQGSPMIDTQQSVQALGWMGRLLTHLTLDMELEAHTRPLILQEVLDACPNLESLTCERMYVEFYQAQFTRYPNLTVLKLPHMCGILPYDTMIGVLSRLPSLRILAIGKCYDMRPLLTLREHCPLLQMVLYGGGDALWEPSNVVWDPLDENMQGLQVLGIGDLSFECRVDDMLLLLSQHALTLRTFYLTQDLRWQERIKFPNATYPHMKHIAIQSTYSDPQEQHVRLLEWLLRHSPSLISLKTVRIPFDAPIVNAITRVPKLSKVDITTDGDTGEESTSLVPFINQLVTQCKVRSLRFTIAYTKNQSAIMDAVAKMTHLDQVELDTGGWMMTDRHIPFMQALAHHSPQVERLVLTNQEGFSDNFLFGIHTWFPHLKALTLSTTRIPDTGLMSLLACQQLESLRIQSEGVRSEVQEALQTRIRHVTIL